LLIGKIGRDAFGGDLRNFLTSKSVDLTYLTDTSATSTGTAIITTSESDNAIVVIPGANARLDPADFADVLFEPSDVLVAQFEIPQPTIKAFFEQGKRAGARTILNPAPASKLIPGLFDLVDVLVLNESELALLSSQRLDEASSLDDVCGALRVLNPAGGQVLCATLGSRGAVALISGEPLVQPAQEVTVVDTTGAGDCFVGAVACELARGSKFVDAMTYGQVAASICVQRRGAGPSMPTYQEIARHF
jgi:ribokinase